MSSGIEALIVGEQWPRCSSCAYSIEAIHMLRTCMGHRELSTTSGGLEFGQSVNLVSEGSSSWRRRRAGITKELCSLPLFDGRDARLAVRTPHAGRNPLMTHRLSPLPKSRAPESACFRCVLVVSHVSSLSCAATAPFARACPLLALSVCGTNRRPRHHAKRVVFADGTPERLKRVDWRCVFDVDKHFIPDFLGRRIVRLR